MLDCLKRRRSGRITTWSGSSLFKCKSIYLNIDLTASSIYCGSLSCVISLNSLTDVYFYLLQWNGIHTSSVSVREWADDSIWCCRRNLGIDCYHYILVGIELIDDIIYLAKGIWNKPQSVKSVLSIQTGLRFCAIYASIYFPSRPIVKQHTHAFVINFRNGPQGMFMLSMCCLGWMN